MPAAGSESTVTTGRPDRPMSSISGPSVRRPMATTPATSLPLMAGPMGPCSGEMNWTANPAASEAASAPAANSPKYGFANIVPRAVGARIAIVP